MTDVIFNTLLAVQFMCTAHHYITWQGTNVPVPSNVAEAKYQKGFEDCLAIDKAIEGERVRRDLLLAAKYLAADKARLANAIAAMNGKPFKPEAPVESLMLKGGCISPVATAPPMPLDR